MLKQEIAKLPSWWRITWSTPWRWCRRRTCCLWFVAFAVFALLPNQVLRRQTAFSADENDVEEGGGALREMTGRNQSPLSLQSTRSRSYTETVSTIDPYAPPKVPLVFERHRSAYQSSISSRDTATAEAIADKNRQSRQVSDYECSTHMFMMPTEPNGT